MKHTQLEIEETMKVFNCNRDIAIKKLNKASKQVWKDENGLEYKTMPISIDRNGNNIF